MDVNDSGQPSNINRDDSGQPSNLNDDNTVVTSNLNQEDFIITSNLKQDDADVTSNLNQDIYEGKCGKEEKIEEAKKVDEPMEKNESKVFYKTQPDCPIYQVSQSSEESNNNNTPESLGKRLLKGEDISILSPSDTIPVINYLSSYRDEHLRNHDVKEGEHAEKIINQIQENRKSSIKGSIAEEKAKELQQRIDEANQELADLEQRVQNTMTSLKNENQNNLDKLRQKHEQEMDSFTSKWQSKQYTKRFSRASTALRNLRVQSILLMNQKRFDELRKTDQIASKLEKEETDEMSRAMNHEYDRQLKMLTEKQQNELNVLKSTQQRRVANLKSAGDEAIETLKKRINHLQYNLSIAKDPVKYWNVYHRNESSVLSRAVNSSNKQSNNKKMKNGQKRLNMTQINTLKLPPLIDPRAKKSNKGKSQTFSPSK